MAVEWGSTLDEILDRGLPEDSDRVSRSPRHGRSARECTGTQRLAEPEGVAPRVAAMIASDLGVELEIIETLWPDQIPALLDRKVDLLPKHTLIPQRALRLEFVMGRLMQIRITCQVPAERANDGNRVASVEQGLRIGVWHGSSNRDVAERYLPGKANISRRLEPDPFVAGRKRRCRRR